MLQPKDRLAEWLQKQDQYIHCLQETHFRSGDTYRLKVRKWKKYSMQMEIKRKSELQYLYQTKIDFNKDCYKRQRHYIMSKGSVKEEDYNNCKYICTQHRSTSIYKARANSHKGKIDSNTMIVGDLNTQLTSMDRSSRQKINKETQVTPILLKLFQKTAEERTLPNLFSEATITLIPKPDKNITQKKKFIGQYH